MELTPSEGQYQLVDNSFPLVIAAMGAALVYFLLVRREARWHASVISADTPPSLQAASAA